mgnify:CR=1 FL=1
MAKLFKVLKSRTVLVGLAILIQAAWYILFLRQLTSYSVFINGFFRILSVVIVLYLIRKDENSAYKIAWIILIMLIPLLGGILYVLVGNKKPSKKIAQKMAVVKDGMKDTMKQNEEILAEVRAQNANVAGSMNYLGTLGRYPVWKHTSVKYFPIGEEMFASMLEDLKKAEHYIYLEYFIIEEGIMWNTILDILEEKVKEGVDVRVMYDDVGCIFNLPSHYADFLRKKGIKCIVFNRYIPIFSTVFNNRDHRKILVIDGDVAFTGGINFADEYINEKQRFGYWKDNGVRITGKAVYSMTQMFLQMWNAFALEKDKLDYEKFCLEDVRPLAKEERGIVLPYSDHPLDSEFVGESVYINLINSAQKYIYFFTPYLIIDNEVVTALILAAKRGVDVRIITPGIPDKKMIFLVTQSYYPQLVEGGVQIFQYRPGFVHAKCAVCDDKIATVGTINLDYRSLYLHFENGLFLYNNDTVMDIKKDILDTLEDCNRIMPEMCKKNMFFLLLQGILRIFAPLL